GEAARTRVSALPAAEPQPTLAAPIRPAAPTAASDRQSVLDDLTLVRSGPVRSSGPRATAVPAPVRHPAAGAQVARSSRPKTALSAGGVALGLLAAGVGGWWLNRKPAPPSPPPAPSPAPQVAVTPVAAPSPTPAVSETPAATEELRVAEKAEKKDRK